MTQTDPSLNNSDERFQNYDLFGDDYVANPGEFWANYRDKCPVAHSDLHGGSWLPVRYEDVQATARDIEHFPSGHGISVVGPGDDEEDGDSMLPGGVPPIDADPPLHTWTRRLILPSMAPKAVESYEAGTRELCQRLIAGFIDAGKADAAADYAQQIPVRVIGALLGVSEDKSDDFVGWVRGILEYAYDKDRRKEAVMATASFLLEEIAKRKETPTEDLISDLINSEVEGEPVDEMFVLGEAFLLMVAGIDTTWSAIGAAMYHFAAHPEDRRRMVEDPDVWPLAIEEILRFYAPVTMARVAEDGAEINGCPIPEGDRVLMSFPAANRDPDVFEDADEFIIDRAKNRHLAFGVGIHRCAGSNLARMEVRLALEEWFKAIPEFELTDPESVTWAGGQVRGPRSIPVTFPTR